MIHEPFFGEQQRITPAELFYLAFQFLQAVHIRGRRQGLVNESGDDLHLRLLHAPGGQGRAAEADTAGGAGRPLVEGDGVLVDGDAGLIQGLFRLPAGKAGGMS